jgi:uncharacterized repeat protein (TIGR01451 family)
MYRRGGVPSLWFAPLVGSLALLLGVAVSAVCPALAAAAGPHWSILSQSEPTYFKAGDLADAYRLIVRNDGARQTTSGSVVSVTDTLPSGVAAVKVSASGEGPNGNGQPRYSMTCPEAPVVGAATCTYAESATQGPVLPGAVFVVTITVAIPSGVQALSPNSATVSGGGAPDASTSETTPIDAEIVPFALAFSDLDVADENGGAETQADSHPFELTESVAFNVSSREVPSQHNRGAESPLANAAPKDLEVELPPGLVGDPNAVPQCAQQAFLEAEELNCPLDTQVGTVKPYFYGLFPSAVFPLYNVVPPPGVPAELAFSVGGVGHVPIFLGVKVRSDGRYVVTASLSGIPETGPLQGAILTLWGVPADPSHDLEREGTLGEGRQEDGEFCKPSVEVQGGLETQERCPSGAPTRAFLTMPSRCEAGPLTVDALSDSWQNQSSLLSLKTDANAGEAEASEGITGCERLSFTPSLALAPETTQAGAPSGYTLAVHLPQNADPEALSTPDLRAIVVSLPAGVVLSPAVGSGLQSCSQVQFGLQPFGPGSLAPASCPPQSQIGTAKITTPLLASPLEGQLFLGAPACAPCTAADAQEGKLIRVLLQAQGAGVTIKLEGSAAIDQATGQLTVSFRESPEWPLEDVKLTLGGGSNAPLVNPSTCGTPLAATSQLTPYSSETPAEPSSEPFTLSGCSAAQFHPSFVAGTTSNQAGAFSPATITLSRTDADEDLRALTVHLPPGLLGMLSKVQLCSAAQAQVDACGSQSQIGTATIGAGPGATPLFLGGSVYLTGPYEGAPFGLSIVVPAVVGPLDLGTIAVGARIEVDPSTAALTLISDPLPQSLDGIPLQIKTANLDIDRAGFAFNPTDCRPLTIDSALESSEAATALVSSRFQAANCATLPFKPKLSALTHAHAGKVGGVHLHVRLVSALGQANIAKVKVDLPRQVAVRQRTLQTACLLAVLQVNPANCPAGSVVGSATVLTPVLRAPLAGPVYLVSRGGASPEVVLVLRGEGVVLALVGQTRVVHGITSATFTSLPDAPISEFDLLLDAGPHSLLAANLAAKARASMCGQPLSMTSVLTAQNGAVRKQTIKIAVSGCPTRRRSLRG